MDFADRFNHTMPTEKPEGFEWNGVSTTNRTLIKEEKLETLYYSPYENFINGNLVLWANFMFELYRFYLDILNGIKRLSTYKVPRKQIQEFLNKIGYNVEDYEIITTDDIVEIQNSNVCLHAVDYNERKVAQGKAELLQMTNFGFVGAVGKYTPDDLKQYLVEYSSRINKRIRRPQFHLGISCRGDEYTKEQLVNFAHQYLREMGYAEEGQPLLIYSHHDTANNHIHIVTSRVAPDGHKIDHNHEYCFAFFPKRGLKIFCLSVSIDFNSSKVLYGCPFIGKMALLDRFSLITYSTK